MKNILKMTMTSKQNNANWHNNPVLNSQFVLWHHMCYKKLQIIPAKQSNF